MKAMGLFGSKKFRYKLTAYLILFAVFGFSILQRPSTQKLLSPLTNQLQPLTPLTQVKNTHEVFGFAPYWNITKLSNVNFNTLTTFAYFGVEVDSDGNLIKDSRYQTFISSQATDLFKKAHASGTRVVLTLTQMENGPIEATLDNPDAQKTVISQAVSLVKHRGIDGLNVDFEYGGDPGQDYRSKFTQFVADLTNEMHRQVPSSKVTISVYAASAKDPKIYDIGPLSRVADGIFMMAYDFANVGADNAIPTAPLYGHQNGKYWYDVASAVNDFLALMPASKLILGVPYYGYNYVVYEPSVKAQTLPFYSWKGSPESETYAVVQDSFNSNLDGVDQVIKGWDDDGKVGYFAYHLTQTDTWRMIFMEDSRSLGLKYDFAKGKGLMGVGVWALGNDDGKTELWTLLEEKFGTNQLANNEFATRVVNDVNE